MSEGRDSGVGDLALPGLPAGAFSLPERPSGIVRAISNSEVALERWLGDVKAAFDGRVLRIDHSVADQWGCMIALRRVSAIDGLLAATAVTHGLALATRTESKVARLGATLINPVKGAEHAHAS